MIRPGGENDALRETLVQAACAIVEERGVQALTLTGLAARQGISPILVERHFETRDALLEAMAEYWFRPKVAIMEDVLASDLPARRKLYEFFARRFERFREAWDADPAVVRMYVELGSAHYEQVRSYLDLADHYLGEIIGQAMHEGHFAGLEIDETISLVNQMVAPYCSHATTIMMIDRLSVEKLARIIDALCDGLSAHDRGAAGIASMRAA